MPVSIGCIQPYRITIHTVDAKAFPHLSRQNGDRASRAVANRAGVLGAKPPATLVICYLLSFLRVALWLNFVFLSSPVFAARSRTPGAPSTRTGRRVAHPPARLGRHQSAFVAVGRTPRSPGAGTALVSRFPRMLHMSRRGRHPPSASFGSTHASDFAPASRGIRRASARVVRHPPSSRAPWPRRPSAIHRGLALGTRSAQDPPPADVALRKTARRDFVSPAGNLQLRIRLPVRRRNQSKSELRRASHRISACAAILPRSVTSSISISSINSRRIFLGVCPHSVPTQH